MTAAPAELQTNSAIEDAGFDEDSLDFLAELLSDAYTYPEEAVLREYVANGLDATVDAGSSAPVEVTTPTAFDRNLTITDHGTGMDFAQVRKNFVMYGGSTKRGRADGIGGFGIGSKCGYAVAATINVVSVRDRVRTAMTIIRAEIGTKVTYQDERPTDEPNGTTVTLPVDPGYDWQEAARRVFAYAGSRVELDGEVIADIRGEDPESLTVVHSGGPEVPSGDRVVMGGPNYRLTETMREMVCKRILGPGAVVVEVEDKQLQVTHSREFIKDSAANREAFARVLDHWVRAHEAEHLHNNSWETWKHIKQTPGDILRTRAINDHLKTVDTVLRRTADADPHNPVVAFSLDDPDDRREVYGRASRSPRRHRLTAHTAGTGADLDRILFVHGHDADLGRSPKITAWLRDHVDPHAVEEGRAVLVLIGDDDEFAGLAEAGLNTMTADQLRAYKPAKASPPKPRQVGYRVVDLAGSRTHTMYPDEIAEAFDRVDFTDEDLPRTPMSQRVLAADVDRQFPGQRLGLVEVTTQQSLQRARERIITERFDLAAAQQQAKDHYRSLLSADEKSKLVAIRAARSLSGRFYTVRAPRSADELREKLGGSDLHMVRSVLEAVETLAADYGVDHRERLADARATLAAVEDTGWIDRISARLTDEQIDTALSACWAEIDERAGSEDIWGLVAEIAEAPAFRVVDEQQRLMVVAGFFTIRG